MGVLGGSGSGCRRSCWNRSSISLSRVCNLQAVKPPAGRRGGYLTVFLLRIAQIIITLVFYFSIPTEAGCQAVKVGYDRM